MYYFLSIACVLSFCMSVVCSLDNVTETFLQNDTLRDSSNDSHSILDGKHESLKTCALFSLEPGEYELFSNGSVHIEVYNLTLSESHYLLYNDLVTVCMPFHNVESEQKYADKYGSVHVTLIGLGISMICLFIHLIIFSIVPKLRNLPGWNLAALCASLFLSYLLYFVINTGEIQVYQHVCITIASLTHFFMLASILWMSIMSYDVYLSLLRATGSFRSSSTQFKWKRFGLYCLCSFGIAFLFALSSLLADVLDIVPQQFRPEFGKICWFDKKTPLLIFFAGPVIALTCLNFIFFGLSAYTLHFNKMKVDSEDQKSILRRRYLMYFRLSAIMGITWIVGIVAIIANVSWLWDIFALLNTLQGFFIFLGFTCKKKVRKYFREKFLGGRRASQQTLAPTFQSYCFYANSIEKDLDKVVENSKEKTDTIMIHL